MVLAWVVGAWATAPLRPDLAAVPEQGAVGSDNPAGYYRLVIPRVGQEEWARAVQVLGTNAPAPHDSTTAIDDYERQLENISAEIGAFCSARSFREQLAEIAVGGGSNAGAVATARECFDRLKSRTWPRADTAIEDTWRGLTAGIDPEDTEAVARANRAKSSLIRAVYLRHVSSPHGWSSAGEGVDLRSLLANQGARRTVSGPFAALAARISGDSRLSKDSDVDAAAADVERILAEHESHSMAQLTQYFREYRADSARLPGPHEDLKTFAESRHSRRVRAARPLSDALFQTIDQVSAAIEQRLGVEARSDWEDVTWSAALPMAFQTELPTHAIRWIESCELPSDVIGACRVSYRQYLDERSALRNQMRESLLDAKRSSAAPVIPGSIESRMCEAIAVSRRALSMAAVDRFKAVLDADTSARLDKFMSAIRQEWDPARNWRNL